MARLTREPLDGALFESLIKDLSQKWDVVQTNGALVWDGQTRKWILIMEHVIRRKTICLVNHLLFAVVIFEIFPQLYHSVFVYLFNVTSKLNVSRTYTNILYCCAHFTKYHMTNWTVRTQRERVTTLHHFFQIIHAQYFRYTSSSNVTLNLSRTAYFTNDIQSHQWQDSGISSPSKGHPELLCHPISYY